MIMYTIGDHSMLSHMQVRTGSVFVEGNRGLFSVDYLLIGTRMKQKTSLHCQDGTCHVWEHGRVMTSRAAELFA